MSEYSYESKSAGSKDTAAQSAAQQTTNGIPNSVMQEVFAGRRSADSSMVGHRQNLAPSVQAKMSRAFGMDFSNVQLYRTDAMDGTGMRGVSQGNRVVLGNDVNLNTLEGQTILGHELSHVRAQSMGIGMGHSGLLHDASLEHQADVEGSMAARGLSVGQEGMTMGAGLSVGLGMAGIGGLTPIGGGMSANAAAPMQAKENKPGLGERLGWRSSYITEKNINKDGGAYGNALRGIDDDYERQIKKNYRGEVNGQVNSQIEAKRRQVIAREAKKKNRELTKDELDNINKQFDEQIQKPRANYEKKLWDQVRNNKSLRSVRDTAVSSNLKKIENRSRLLGEGEDGAWTNKGDWNRTGDVGRLTGWTRSNWNPLTWLAYITNYGNWKSNIAKRAKKEEDSLDADEYRTRSMMRGDDRIGVFDEEDEENYVDEDNSQML